MSRDPARLSDFSFFVLSLILIFIWRIFRAEVLFFLLCVYAEFVFFTVPFVFCFCKELEFCLLLWVAKRREGNFAEA